MEGEAAVQVEHFFTCRPLFFLRSGWSSNIYILADEIFVCALLDDAFSGELWQRRGRMLLKSRC